MSLVLLTNFRQVLSKYFESIAKNLSHLGLSPNHVTLLSLLTALLAVYMMLSNNILFFSFTVLLSGFFDVLDGALARVTGKTSRFGAFLDSSVDRIVDSIFILSLKYILSVSELEIYTLLIVSFMISYARARAEALGVKIEGIGIIERAERIIFIFIISLLTLYSMLIAVTIFRILLGLSIITFIQRLYHVYKVAR